MQSEGSYQGDLTAPFSGSLLAKYPPSIPWSLTFELHSPSHPATLPTIAWIRLSHPAAFTGEPLAEHEKWLVPYLDYDPA